MIDNPAAEVAQAPADQLDTGRVPLGRAPRPTAAGEIERRLRDALRSALWSAFDVVGLDAARIAVEPAGGVGPDLMRLDIDLTAVELSPRPALSTPTAVPRDGGKASHGAGAAAESRPGWAELTAEFGEPVNSEPAVLHSGTVEAQPVVIAGVPVRVSASLTDLPFTWVTSAGGELAAELDADSDPSTIRLRVSLAPDAVADLLRATLEASGQMRVLQVRLDLVASGPRTLQIRGFLRVGRRGLTIGAKVRAVVSIDDNLVATVPVIRVRSFNPVVMGVLLGLRSQLRALRSRRFPLAVGRMRVRDVRVTTGREMTIEAEAVRVEVPGMP